MNEQLIYLTTNGRLPVRYETKGVFRSKVTSIRRRMTNIKSLSDKGLVLQTISTESL